MKIQLKTAEEVYMFWEKMPERKLSDGYSTYFFDSYSIKLLYCGKLSYHHSGFIYSNQILQFEKKPQ